MRKTDKDLSRYLREVRILLPCSRKRKNDISARFRASVEDYCSDHPDADIAQIRKHFGAPEDIAAAYVENEGTAEILSALLLRKRAMAIVAVVAALILASWFAAWGWAVIHADDVMHGDIVVTYSEWDGPLQNGQAQEDITYAP